MAPAAAMMKASAVDSKPSIHRLVVFNFLIIIHLSVVRLALRSRAGGLTRRICGPVRAGLAIGSARVVDNR